MPSAVILTGAGASFDSTSSRVGGPGPRPPLVASLFSNQFTKQLNRYPLVRLAAADIRQATGPDAEDAIPLERYLREQMSTSDNPYTQRRYRQVPLYLQEVLTWASGYSDEPDNYNALTNRALELDDVLFLTLNYDTLLDERFTKYWPRNGRDWYIDTDSRWALVKLHGSVNWAWPLALGPESLQLDPNDHRTANNLIDVYGRDNPMAFSSDDIVLRDQPTVEARRFDAEEAVVYYPALAVPLGEDDDLVCPSRHMEAAKDRLTRSDGLNLLVIGYSGVDREVLRIFSDSGNTIRKLLVVNGSAEPSRVAGLKIARAFNHNPSDDSFFDGGFSQLVTSGELARWIASL